MTTVRALLTISLALFTVTACSTVRVSNGNDNLPGIPFFAKKEARFQETTWVDNQHVLTVTFSAKDQSKKDFDGVPPWTSGRVALSKKAAASKEMLELRLFVLKAPSSAQKPAVVNRWRSKLVELVEDVIRANQADVDSRSNRTHDVPGDDEDLTLVSNLIKSKLVVDSNNILYINGRHPWVGTGKGTFEFRDDMTLTKAETEVTDSTLSTFLELLPVSEFFTKQWNLIPEVVGDDADERLIQASVNLSVVAETTIYKITRELGNLCTQDETCEKIDFGVPMTLLEGRLGTKGAQLEVSKPAKPKTPDKKAPPAYKIEGSIALPEVKPAAK